MLTELAAGLELKSALRTDVRYAPMIGSPATDFSVLSSAKKMIPILF